MNYEYQESDSEKKFWQSHLLAEAAQKAPRDSATRRGLWNAASKKVMVAEALDQLEKEREKRNGDK